MLLPLSLASVVAAAVAAASPDDKSALEQQPQGWTDIMPGPRLQGWSRVAPISTRNVKSVVNRDLKIWHVDRKTGVLDCRAHLAPPGETNGSHEMLRHDKELGDFIFHVEWRFVDPARKGWNAGVYARVRDVTVWHQAQVGNASGGYWFGDSPDPGGKIVRHQFAASTQRVKPVGQWNIYEITARGDSLILWVNGAVVSEWRGLRVPRGHVGLEAERHHIEFRNLKLKPLGP